MGLIFRTAIVLCGALAIASRPGATYLELGAYLVIGALFQWSGGQD